MAAIFLVQPSFLTSAFAAISAYDTVTLVSLAAAMLVFVAGLPHLLSYLF